MRFHNLFLFLMVLGFLSCSSEKKSIYLSEYSYKAANNRLEQAFREAGFHEIEQSELIEPLTTWQKNTRYQAQKNIKYPEANKKWQFWQSPDSVIAYISYVPPKYYVISKKLTQALIEVDSLDLSPLFFHYFSHYEMGHLRKRSESTLAGPFGGLNSVLAIQNQPKEYVREMIVRNGAKSGTSVIYPFSIEEETKAEWLAAKAWKMEREDSLEIFTPWRMITPDFSWAEDYFQIHIGKTKMAN